MGDKSTGPGNEMHEGGRLHGGLRHASIPRLGAFASDDDIAAFVEGCARADAYDVFALVDIRPARASAAREWWFRRRARLRPRAVHARGACPRCARGPRAPEAA